MQIFIRLEYPAGPNVLHPNPIEAFGDGLPNPDLTHDYFGPFNSVDDAEKLLRSKGAVQREDEAFPDHPEGEEWSVWDYGDNRCEAVVMRLQPPSDMPDPLFIGSTAM